MDGPCAHEDVDYETEMGGAVCTKCGVVLEESNNIVSDLAFTETAKGGTSVFGQFVSATQAPFRRLPGWSREAREVTLSQGRKIIQQIAGKVDLKLVHINSAMRIFNIAVTKNFIQGRRTKNVCCVCLYIASRTLKTAHMLLDFAEHMNLDVYVLGATFLKLVRAAKIKVPLVDPCLFIQRFASRLQFEEKTQVVAADALKIVSHMKRDWMQMGRRPAGLCGAGLLLAARLHGFKRSQREVVEVVKVCDITLRNRLREFMDTRTAEMGLEEFNLTEVTETSLQDLCAPENCDPPAYSRNLLNPKQTPGTQLDIQWVEMAREAEAALTANEGLRELHDELDPDFNATQPLSAPLAEDEQEDEPRQQQQQHQHQHQEQQPSDADLDAQDRADAARLQQQEREQRQGLTLAQLAMEERAADAIEEGSVSDLDDEEAKEFIVTNVKLLGHKERMWKELNKDWLELQEKKEQERRAKMRAPAEEERALAEQKRNRQKKRKERRQQLEEGDERFDMTSAPPRTAAQAVSGALASKKSAKIDYSVLNKLFDASPTQAPAAATATAPAVTDDGDDAADN